jgi:hypothetical protein
MKPLAAVIAPPSGIVEAQEAFANAIRSALSRTPASGEGR